MKILENFILPRRGYKKSKLNDTKGVLTSRNNYKWVRSFARQVDGATSVVEQTIYPNGSKLMKVINPENNVVKKKFFLNSRDRYYQTVRCYENHGLTYFENLRGLSKDLFNKNFK